MADDRYDVEDVETMGDGPGVAKVWAYAIAAVSALLLGLLGVVAVAIVERVRL